MTVVVWMRMVPGGSVLDAWFPGAGKVWEGLGGVPLLEEVCHQRRALST